MGSAACVPHDDRQQRRHRHPFHGHDQYTQPTLVQWPHSPTIGPTYEVMVIGPPLSLSGPIGDPVIDVAPDVKG